MADDFSALLKGQCQLPRSYGQDTHPYGAYNQICLSQINFQHIYTKILSFFTIISYNIIIKDVI